MSVHKLFILLGIFLCSINLSFGQKSKDKLKREQKRLEEKIAATKDLLGKTQTSAQATLNQLKLIDDQVKSREALLLNIDNQIRGAELKIEQKNGQIDELEKKLLSLKEQYRKLTIYAYKHRNKDGQTMYIISSDNYYEAIKRKKYLEKVAEIQEKQKLIIRQHQKLVEKEREELQQEKSYKVAMISEKKQERSKILADKRQQQEVFDELKKEENRLMTEIRKNEIRRQKVKAEIDAAIAREIEAARKKREVKKTTSSTPKEKKSAPVILAERKEAELNSNFESNKGRLPWPVAKGAITESYGKHLHPTIKNLYTRNNGVDISAPKGAQVRSVFTGEVSSVFSIPGAGKVVIVKHGNYRSVYSNLEEVYVSAGMKVKTKQAVGSLLKLDGEELSISHFEIHKVVGNNVERMNPELWISR